MWFNLKLASFTNNFFSRLDLEEEIQKSELSSEQIQCIQRHSRGVFSIYQFLDHASAENIKNGYIIGLTSTLLYPTGISYAGLISLREHSPAIGQALDFTAWEDAYLHFFGELEEKTDEFLSSLTALSRPIVFLMPRELYSYHEDGATQREFAWFLQHPQFMKNVYFVFGAYVSVSYDAYAQTIYPSYHPFPLRNLAVEQKINLFAELYKNHQNYLKPPF